MRFDRSMLRLYAITDRRGLPEGMTLAEAVRLSIEGGATIVQLREKHMERAALLAEAREVLAVCRAAGVPLIINDDAQLALEVGADGVHVGQGDLAADRARRILGGDRIVGVTAKTPEQALRAAADGADYLGSGAVFGSATKTDAVPMTRERLMEITAASPLPVAAIGGITAENAGQLAGTGIAGICAVSAIFGSPDIRRAAVGLREIADRIAEP